MDSRPDVGFRSGPLWNRTSEVPGGWAGEACSDLEKLTNLIEGLAREGERLHETRLLLSPGDCVFCPVSTASLSPLAPHLPKAVSFVVPHLMSWMGASVSDWFLKESSSRELDDWLSVVNIPLTSRYTHSAITFDCWSGEKGATNGVNTMALQSTMGAEPTIA